MTEDMKRDALQMIRLGLPPDVACAAVSGSHDVPPDLELEAQTAELYCFETLHRRIGLSEDPEAREWLRDNLPVAEPMSPAPQLPLNGEKNGRDQKGRYLPGHRGGPGRPTRKTESDYVRVLSDRVPLELWGRIVDRAVADALAGDSKARAFLARYLLGSNQTLLGVAAEEASGVDLGQI